MITMNLKAGEKLTPEQIKDIAQHEKEDYKSNKSYYKSKNPELYATWQTRRQSQISPNNFAPSGYARYIVDTLTGYIASPGFIEYSSENDDYLSVIKDINKANKEKTVTNKEVREAGIQGEDFELHYLDKKDNKIMPRFLSVPGNECYPIYSRDLDPELIAFVRSIKHEDNYDVWVYYPDVIQRYTIKNDTISANGQDEKNLYGVIPWNVGRNNIDYEPDFKQVETYINIIDSIQTNTLNALDKNGRSIILTSMSKSMEVQKNLKDMNIVFDMERGDGEDGKDFFEYASMELNTDLREHMLDHFINELHKISGVFDFTKLDLGQDPSGTALKYRIYPMELKASEKVAYRLEFLRRRYELITIIINGFTISGSKNVSGADVDELDITMNRNLPANIKAILEENVLMGMDVDTETKLNRIPGVDPEKVLANKKKEFTNITNDPILNKQPAVVK